MPYDQRENTGSIFINEDKPKDGANPGWPDRTGKAMVDGVMYWVNGWLKKTKDGNSWLSLAFKRMDKQPNPQAQDEFSGGSAPPDDETPQF